MISRLLRSVFSSRFCILQFACESQGSALPAQYDLGQEPELDHGESEDTNGTSQLLDIDGVQDLVAVMVVGQARRMLEDVERTRMATQFSASIRRDFRKRGLTSAFQSHVLHVLTPLRRVGTVPEYLLCVDVMKRRQIPSEIAQVWTFQAGSQTERIQACVKRILVRERKHNFTYAYFARLRPDFLVMSDFPDPRSRGQGCMLARLRAAVNIVGLTNEHLSFCYCAKHCCSDGFLKGDLPGYIVDDMLSISSRDLFLQLWAAPASSGGLPTAWPQMSRMPETELTTRVLQQGVPVCPLAVRGLPLGSFGIVHGDEASRCGYMEDQPPIPQTECGLNQTSADSLSSLTPPIPSLETSARG